MAYGVILRYKDGDEMLYGKEYREKNNASIRAFRARRKASGVCLRCEAPAKNGRVHCEAHLAVITDAEMRRFNAVRDTVLNHYGAKCACCGESHRAMLTLDHIAEDGQAHRSKIKAGTNATKRVYADVIAQGFPPSFQILCLSCNMAKSRNGGVCPHNEV